MEIVFKNYKYKENNLNFTIKEISGIITDNIEEIVDIIRLKLKYTGKIIKDGETIKDPIKYKNKINIVPDEIDNSIHFQTVYDLLEYEVLKRKINPKNIEKKVEDSLKVVGLKSNILDRNIYTLSSYEKKFVQVAKALLSNPDLLILIEPFKTLDKNNKKKLIMLLEKIKDNYNKTIIIIDNNINYLYNYTNHLIIFFNNKIIKEGNTFDILTNIDFLNKNKIDIPDIVEITYLAYKNKKVKIDYHKDIRDIIKDIYKHV